MTVTIVGAQLGDEGKGRVVDLFGERADIVARYQGGDNAGHTVVEDGVEYKLSLVPSGAIRGKIGLLGNGCVVNPRTLFEELDDLHDQGLDPDVRVAQRAHVILPYHRVLDGLEEAEKGESDQAVGTTGRGIGPTYEDKAGRRGVRVGDLLDGAVLRDRLEYVLPQKRALVEDVYGESIEAVDDPAAFDADSLYAEYREYGRRLAAENMAVNAGDFLASAMDDGRSVMLEGAQGTIIDIDHGNYPYVTSSNPTAGGAATGTGLSPGVIGDGGVVGVVKAYLSRVGSGPMPTELGGVAAATSGDDHSSDGEEDNLATYIRDEGGEYGTVTGRPRRVGWLDMPMLRHATRASGFTGLVVNHVDTLAGLDTVRVGHAYELDGDRHLTMPPTTEAWGRVDVEYREFDGWPDVDWASVAAGGYDAVPAAARRYLEYVTDELETPLYAVGVGPGRRESVVLRNPFED